MKTVIIGNSGSGKTWLARHLAELELAPVVHLDDLFWQPGGFDSRRPADELAQMLREARSRPSWIGEGVFGELAESFLKAADRLVWLDIEWPICHQRLGQRGSESKAHMAREQSHAGLARLVEWAASYSTRADGCSFAGHAKLFHAFSGTRIRLLSEREAAQFVATLGKAGRITKHPR